MLNENKEREAELGLLQRRISLSIEENTERSSGESSIRKRNRELREGEGAPTRKESEKERVLTSDTKGAPFGELQAQNWGMALFF